LTTRRWRNSFPWNLMASTAIIIRPAFSKRCALDDERRWRKTFL
jgi:hypothetical protein